MLTLTLTKFGADKPVVSTYEGNEGAALLAMMEADEHIRSGGWCLLEKDNVAHFLSKPLFGKDGSLC